MEIKLNEEALSKIVNEEVLRKLDEQEQTILKFKYECSKNDVLEKVNDVFNFYYYFKDYVNECKSKSNTRGYVEWRGNTEVWKVYFDLVQKHGLGFVDNIIYEHFIKKAIEEEAEEEKEE